MNDPWIMTGIRQDVVMKGINPMLAVPTYMLTPPDIVEIVCDADWSVSKGLQTRADQFVIRESWLETMPWAYHRTEDLVKARQKAAPL